MSAARQPIREYRAGLFEKHVAINREYYMKWNVSALRFRAMWKYVLAYGMPCFSFASETDMVQNTESAEWERRKKILRRIERRVRHMPDREKKNNNTRTNDLSEIYGRKKQL